MNKILKAIGIILLGGFCLVSAAASGQEDAAAAQALTIVDSVGHKVPVPAATERIVCTNSGLSVLLGALGKGDDMVGRDSNSTFPAAIRSVYVVANNSSSPNIELILEKKPDLILADNMFPAAAYEKFTSLGIPVGIFKTSDPRAFEHTILSVGTLTGTREKAEEMVSSMNSEINRIEGIVEKAKLAKGGETALFYENRKPYSSVSAKSGNNIPLMSAGARNIAADEPTSSPKLSVEYVMEQNPEVIIRRMSGDGTAEVMQNMVESIKGRTGLDEVSAVQNDKVYAIKADLTLLIRYPVGVAYMASWLYPEAAAELDPEGLHEAIVNKYFGPDEWKATREVFVYP